MNENDRERFADAIHKYEESYLNINEKSIGTLGERCLHAILKLFYDDDTTHHEIQICDHVADIFDGCEVTEIQTNNFYSLNKKLGQYLEKYKVRIVYPVAHIKHIVWLDPETGEIVKRNRSPKTGTGSGFLYEASKIRSFLKHENLIFDIVLVDLDEYRLLSGWDKTRKRGSRRADRKPSALFDIITIDSKYDLRKLLPIDFPQSEFTFAEFSKHVKMREKTARYSLNALIAFGAVERVGKIKNKYIYKLCV